MEVSVAPGVRAFLRDYIESHEELEILLLVHRRGDRDWDSSAVAAELGISLALAREALESLCRAELLRAHRSGPSVSFMASSVPETLDLIEKLAEAYQEHRFDIAAILATHAIERLRTRALRTFSESFIIGRKKDRHG
jgi:hypothetical protein